MKLSMITGQRQIEKFMNQRMVDQIRLDNRNEQAILYFGTFSYFYVLLVIFT